MENYIDRVKETLVTVEESTPPEEASKTVNTFRIVPQNDTSSNIMGENNMEGRYLLQDIIYPDRLTNVSDNIAQTFRELILPKASDMVPNTIMIEDNEEEGWGKRETGKIKTLPSGRTKIKIGKSTKKNMDHRMEKTKCNKNKHRKEHQKREPNIENQETAQNNKEKENIKKKKKKKNSNTRRRQANDNPNNHNNIIPPHNNNYNNNLPNTTTDSPNPVLYSTAQG